MQPGCCVGGAASNPLRRRLLPSRLLDVGRVRQINEALRDAAAGSGSVHSLASIRTLSQDEPPESSKGHGSGPFCIRCAHWMVMAVTGQEQPCDLSPTW